MDQDFRRDPMLSIVIPTLNAEAALSATLPALAREAGLCELVVSDGGSADRTALVARDHDALVVSGPAGRGRQLAAGARASSGDWLLFLHADTRPGSGWRAAAGGFMADPANRRRAGYFRFALDDGDPAARRLEAAVAWRCRRLGLPFGDQGLLIDRGFYFALGGFRPMPLMEDVNLVRRIGRRRLVGLEVPAVTSAARYKRGGYRRRSARNLGLLTAYFLGAPPGLLARLYR